MENAASTSTGLTARSAGLVACRRCGRVHRPTTPHCLQCGAPLQSRDTTSVQRVWAWWLAGLVIYIPANLYPMLLTDSLGKESGSTILGGVIELIHHGSFAVAFIVFFASIIIPVSKFIAIAYLALTMQRKIILRVHQRHILYEVVEFVGRWSMIDVFVVAILSALVQLNFAVSIHPGFAAICFALSVAFTMLSAQSFDPRLIWDRDPPKAQI